MVMRHKARGSDEAWVKTVVSGSLNCEAKKARRAVRHLLPRSYGTITVPLGKAGTWIGLVRCLTSSGRTTFRGNSLP